MTGKKKNNPRIVFLDAATVDYGDIDWRDFAAWPNFVRYASTTQNQLGRRLKAADIVLTNKVVLDSACLFKLSHLKLVCVAATGYNNVDVDGARAAQIAVANVKAYSTRSVAEQTLLFLLSLAHRLLPHHEAAHQHWQRSKIFCVTDYPFAEIGGKTLGIVGYGVIGREVARLAMAFGMKILIAKMPGRHYPAAPQRVPLARLFSQSDFITLHCPLTDATRGLVSEKLLQLLKPSAYLLNLARGPIVNEADVKCALLGNTFAGYAADVLAAEPPPANHPFFDPKLKGKILLSPHIAWASQESRQKLVAELAQNIRAFLSGKRRNRVD